ncbi:TolC family protein [Daejeonia sp. YH14]|uniref:TolC family protein n=1 Tax=Daejeonia sp. YH14 TaxID=3439042 RepID=UPI003F498F42
MHKPIFIFIFFFQCCAAQQHWSLQQCLDYAQKHNPNIQQSLVNISKNQREISEAKGKLLPSANAGIAHSYSFGSTINPSTNSREALNVQYDQFYATAAVDLLNWKNFLNISLSKMNKESSEYQLKTMQNDIKLGIVNLFFQYMKSKSWFEVLEPQISGMKEQIARTEKEVEIGSRAKSDVYDIKANFGTIQEQWISAKNDMNVAKLNLLAALNINKDTVNFVMAENPVKPLAFVTKEDFIDQLVQKNPVYSEAQKNLEIADQRIKVAKSEYLPTLSGTYQWSTFYSKTLNTSGNTAFSEQFSQNKNQQLYFGLNIPVFQQFQVKNKVEMTKLDQLVTKFENQKNLTELYRNLNIIAEQYQNALEKNRILQENFENQKLSFQRSEEKYKEGLIDAYSFFVVRSNWLQASNNLLNSRYDVMLQQELLKIFENQ